MVEVSHYSGIDRCDLLRRAIYIVGGATAAGALGGCSGGERGPDVSTLIGPGGSYFSPKRMTLLDIIADIIIPQTDTPGAKGAGVPAFIDSMMVNWASGETRGKWDGVIDAVDAKASETFDKPFVELSDDQKKDVVKAFDAEQIHASGDYRQFKELLLIGYYQSEVGATEELHYELVPGVWNACAPLSEIGRTWAD